MQSNTISKSMVFALLLTLALAIPVAFAPAKASAAPVLPKSGAGRVTDFEQYGPHLDYGLFTYRKDPTGTFTALDIHEIDLVDWPLDKSWVTKWTGRSDIVMKDTGGEYGEFIFDVNENQTKVLQAGYNVDYYVPTGDPRVITISLHGETAWTTTRGAQFRHALAHLVNRDYIVTTILGGFASPLYTVFPLPYGSTVNPNVDQHPYDPAEAALILDAAGFVDTDGDGWRNKPDPGTPLPGGILVGTGNIQFDFLFRAGPRGRWASEQMIPAMETAGIDVIPEGPVAFGVAYDKVFTNRRKDAYTGGWAGLTTADFAPYLHGRVGWEPPPAFPNNYMLYSGWRDINNDGWTEPDPALEYYSRTGQTPGVWKTDYGLADLKSGYWYDILNIPIPATVATAAYNAQLVMQDKANVYAIPLWMSNAPKAYSLYNELGPGALNEWKGVVNQRAFGVNSIWTCLNAYVDEHPDSGTGREGLSTEDAVSFNNIYSSSYFDAEILGKTQEALLGLDPDDPAALGPPGIIPWVAKGFEFTQESDSQQGGATVTTIKFYMRNDVYWHDGVKMTAADVAFTLKTVPDTVIANGAPSPWWYSNVENLHRVETKVEHPDWDDYTLKVYMKSLSVFYLRNIGFNVIMPQHIWGDPANNAYIGKKAGETQADYILRIMGMAPDKQLIGAGFAKVYPKNVIVGDPNSVYVPGVSFNLKGFKSKLGFAAGPGEDMVNPDTGEYIGHFRNSPVQVADPWQNINTGGTSVKEYILIENFKTSSATVDVEVKLGTPGIVIRTLTGLVVPAATVGGSVSGKYFIDATDLGVNPITNVALKVKVTPAAGIKVSVTSTVSSTDSIAGDVTATGNSPTDKVNVLDAILLSTAFGGTSGPSQAALILGPWTQPNADFNDDSTVDVFDGIRLSTNFPY